MGADEGGPGICVWRDRGSEVAGLDPWKERERDIDVAASRHTPKHTDILQKVTLQNAAIKVTLS